MRHSHDFQLLPHNFPVTSWLNTRIGDFWNRCDVRYGDVVVVDVFVDGREVDLEDCEMCLERITKRYRLKERKTIYGWKIFKRTWDFQTHLDGLFMGGQYLPGKTYITSRGKILIDGIGESYPRGFHVYATVK